MSLLASERPRPIFAYMTYQQAKDFVAQKYGFKDWNTWENLRTLPFSGKTYEEVARVWYESKV